MKISETLALIQTRLEAADVFYGHGTDNPADEALWLLQGAFASLYPDTELNGKLDASKALDKVLENFLQQRIVERTPVAYILGEAWFCDLPILIDENTLIPRSPIAELIVEDFSPWLTRSAEPCRILDLCTGSACIACAIASYVPNVKVDAGDISESALVLARKNRVRLSLESNLEIIQSDLFTALAGRKYDLIVSNPPYVSPVEYADLPEEYLQEPKLGLVSGVDGLDIVLKILTDAPNYLEDTGVLICEVGASQPALAALLPTVPFLWLEFEHGGEGVFLLERGQLIAAKQDIMQVLNLRDPANNLAHSNKH